MTSTLLATAACGGSDAASGSAPGPAAEPSTAAVASSPTQVPKAAKIEVPRGVGLDYQSAQDLWRAAGLHVAPAKDATGENRIPVLDANWIVVSQDPEAGAMVDAGSFITATVKKDSDD
ncbi:PASTA domain-containing protein [Actinoplanes sp. GCM10030250]